MGILSKSLSNYCKLKTNKDISTALLVIPISIRGFPEPFQKLSFSNCFVESYVPLKISGFSNQKEHLSYIHKIFNHLKSSTYIYILYYIFSIVLLFFPLSLVNFLINFIGSKPSIVYSNLPSTTTEVTFLVSQVERFIHFFNINFDIPFGFFVISYNQKILFSCTSDKILDFMDPKEFVEEFQAIMQKEFLKE